MKNSMKKIYAYALGALMLAGFAVLAPSAQASGAVFNNHVFGQDCPTVAVANATTGTPTDSNNCWTTSTSATSNDVVNVVIYYHNNGTETANNVVARLSPQSGGVSSTQIFSGSISASNAATVTGTGTISINPAHSVTFGTVKWYKDKQGSPTPLPNGQTGAELFGNGLNLGSVLGYDTCPVVSGVRDAACHEGWLMVSYRVGTSAAPQPCTVSINANPMVITTGGSSTLSWNSSNCTTVQVTGPTGMISTALNSTQSVSPQYTSTYTITGSNSTGSASPASTTISVQNIVVPTVCSANLQAYDTQVQAGQTTTLSWTSANCDYVTISGPNGTISNAKSGSMPTAPIYGTVTYRLVAGASNTVNQSITLSAYNVNNGTAPTATTLAATVGADGTTATLNGYINSNTACTSGFWGGCNNSNVTYYFKYGTSQYSLYNQTPTQSITTTSGNVSAYLTGLQANTTYYFQLIATNTYGTSYGNTLSFVTNNGAASISAITTVPTNVTTTSARLNGLVTGSNGGLYTGIASVWFEYGTSPSLGLRTNAQTANIVSISNYFDTISTSPNTTYYYRIVASVNGQTVMGSTVSFTTPAVVTTTNTNTNTTTTTTVINRVGTGTGSAFLQLAITDNVQSVIPGDTLSYVVTYQNISGVTLSNVVINVILPTGVTFRQASQGLLTTNNTVATTVGTLLPAALGTFTIQVLTNPTIIPGNTLVTTATAAFTLPTSAQDSAIAYDLDNVVSFQNNLAGLALFGAGFFPTSLLGWILLLGLLLVLILIARYFYHRANAERMAPVSHMRHEAPSASSAHVPYHGDNLPH